MLSSHHKVASSIERARATGQRQRSNGGRHLSMMRCSPSMQRLQLWMLAHFAPPDLECATSPPKKLRAAHGFIWWWSCREKETAQAQRGTKPIGAAEQEFTGNLFHCKHRVRPRPEMLGDPFCPQLDAVSGILHMPSARNTELSLHSQVLSWAPTTKSLKVI